MTRTNSSAATLNSLSLAGRRCRPAPTCIVRTNQLRRTRAPWLAHGGAPHRGRARKRPSANRRKRSSAGEEEERKQQRPATGASSSAAEAVPEHHLVVARLSNEAMKNTKLKDILGPLKSVINAALPLVEVPPLHQVRNALLFEFPYAVEVIDFALADLVGRTTIRLRPLLLVGDPGGGKTVFARRLGEALGLPSIWRTDAAGLTARCSAEPTVAGTRPSPATPCLPSPRARSRNPLVLLDEIEKAGNAQRLRSSLGLPARLPRARDELPLSGSRVADHSRPQPGLLRGHRQQPRSACRARSAIGCEWCQFPKPGANDLDATLASRNCGPGQRTRSRRALGAAARRCRTRRGRTALARRLGAPPAPDRRGHPARTRPSTPRGTDMTDEKPKSTNTVQGVATAAAGAIAGDNVAIRHGRCRQSGYNNTTTTTGPIP